MGKNASEAKRQYTCRHCGQSLYLRSPSTTGRWDRDWFTHTLGGQSEASTAWEDEGRFCSNERRSLALPKEICMFLKESDGEHCQTKVRPENIESGDYACGVHLPKVIEDRERRERSERLERERIERQEIAEWEEGFYQEAYGKLNAMDPELFPADGSPKVHFGRLDRKVSIDIVDLERFIRGVANAEG